MSKTPAFTKTEPSGRAGFRLSVLPLWVSGRREQQSAAGFPGGDGAGVWSPGEELLLFHENADNAGLRPS